MGRVAVAARARSRATLQKGPHRQGLGLHFGTPDGDHPAEGGYGGGVGLAPLQQLPLPGPLWLFVGHGLRVGAAGSASLRRDALAFRKSSITENSPSAEASGGGKHFPVEVLAVPRELAQVWIEREQPGRQSSQSSGLAASGALASGFWNPGSLCLQRGKG